MTVARRAMRLVEVRLREAAGLSTSLLGVKLVQEAFKQGGPLHDDQMEPAESVAVMTLFAGASGYQRVHRDAQ